MKLPKIRGNLLVQELSDEVLIYDQSTNKSYCLNETAKIVFNACDGNRTFADIKLPEDIIYLSLDELKKQDLIDDYASPFAGMSRREVVKKIGLASMVVLPLISSIVAPVAARAASGCPTRVVSNVPNGCPIVGRIGGAGTCGDPATTSNYNTQCQNFYGAVRCSSGKAIYSSCSPQQVQGFVQVTCECSA